MNILPKKKWHVRTKENVARVQRDEENARIQEEHEQRRIAQSESEARINLLRNQSARKYPGSDGSSKQTGHINLFTGLDVPVNNSEAMEEKHKSQKDWEIKVGYLKQLGQGSSELANDKPWYQKKPEDLIDSERRKPNYDTLEMTDPLREMIKCKKAANYQTPIPDVPEKVFVDIDFHDKVQELKEERLKGKTTKHKVKTRKHHKKKKRKISSCSSSDSDDGAKQKKLKAMRDERLRRENAERAKVEDLFQKKDQSHKHENQMKTAVRQKYNSQFNPQFVKSNYR